LPPDPQEAERLADTLARLGLNYVVITPVDRDDLRDGGAAHFAARSRTVRKRTSGTRIEVQTPAFRGRAEVALEILCIDAIDVMNRNLETVSPLSAGAAGCRLRAFAPSAALLRGACGTATSPASCLGSAGPTPEFFGVMRDLRSSVENTAATPAAPPGNLPVRRYAARQPSDRGAGTGDWLCPCRLQSAGAPELPRLASPCGQRLSASTISGDTMNKIDSAAAHKSLYAQVITAIIGVILYGRRSAKR
jgi:hypothetical protein